MNTHTQNEVEALAPAFDVDKILAIHRDPEGFIGFMRKPDPAAIPRLDKHGKPYKTENLFSIRASDLRSMFPAIAHWLTHDAYMTVNAYYRAAPWRNKTTGFPDVWREEKHLRKLTACYSDVDCGREDSEEPGGALDWLQAVMIAEAAMESGHLPQASIMARSGRGVYLLWLLHDEKDPGKLPHAWPESIALYKACNQDLIARLRAYELPADVRAFDAARILRAPGSIHRTAGRRVKYWLRADGKGKGFIYTLAELASFLDIPTIQGELPEHTRRLALPVDFRKTRKKGAAPGRSRGMQTLNATRAQDLKTIEQWRGGFLKRGVKYPDGSTSPGRRFVLSLYANFLHGSGEDLNTTLDALRFMAANMNPEYGSDGPENDPPIETIVKDEYTGERRRRWKNEKLCALLGITAEAARELELKTIKPSELIAEEKASRVTHEEVKESRLAFLREYVARTGKPPTARALAALYEQHGFTGANRGTANHDLKTIRGTIRTRRRLDPNQANLL